MPVFEARVEVRAPVETVWEFLLDPARLGPCVPGAGAVAVLSEGSYRVPVTVRVGFLSTTQDMLMTIVEAERPRRLVAVGRGEDRRLGSQVDVRTELDLVPAGSDATWVSYRSEVKLLGRLGTIGDAVMRAKAAEMAREFGTRMRAGIEGTA